MIILKRTLSSLFILTVFCLIPLETPPKLRAQVPEALPSQTSQTLYLKDELYFGLTKPNGEAISETEWQQFLNEVITPRFQDGLTVLDAYGQYLNRLGLLAKEQSKVVILIYENSPEKNQAIAEIIELYKQRFQQESVLRVTNQVNASF